MVRCSPGLEVDIINYLIPVLISSKYVSRSRWKSDRAGPGAMGERWIVVGRVGMVERWCDDVRCASMESRSPAQSLQLGRNRNRGHRGRVSLRMAVAEAESALLRDGIRWRVQLQCRFMESSDGDCRGKKSRHCNFL
jgi:hypothetical protein